MRGGHKPSPNEVFAMPARSRPFEQSAVRFRIFVGIFAILSAHYAHGYCLTGGQGGTSDYFRGAFDGIPFGGVFGLSRSVGGRGGSGSASGLEA